MRDRATGGPTIVIGVSNIGAAASPMSAPVQLGTGATENSSSDSITHPSVSPDADALILLHVHYRHTAAVGLVTPTAGFATVDGFHAIANDVADSGGVFMDVAAWWARTTGAPGSGTITASFTAPTLQRSLEAYIITGGFDTVTPIRQSAIPL